MSEADSGLKEHGQEVGGMKDSPKRTIDPANKAGAKKSRKQTAAWNPSEEQIRKITRMVAEMNREALQELARH